MKTSPLYFVATIFAVELNTCKGRLIKDFIVAGGEEDKMNPVKAARQKLKAEELKVMTGTRTLR